MKPAAKSTTLAWRYSRVPECRWVAGTLTVGVLLARSVYTAYEIGQALTLGDALMRTVDRRLILPLLREFAPNRRDDGSGRIRLDPIFDKVTR
jgi:hypothetical protein